MEMFYIIMKLKVLKITMSKVRSWWSVFYKGIILFVFYVFSIERKSGIKSVSGYGQTQT